MTGDWASSVNEATLRNNIVTSRDRNCELSAPEATGARMRNLTPPRVGDEAHAGPMRELVRPSPL